MYLKKSNILIYSKCKSDLIEQKIINVVLSKLQNGECENVYKKKASELVYEIRVNELIKIMGITALQLYRHLKVIKKNLEFINTNNIETFNNLIKHIECVNGILKIVINSKSEEYLFPTTQFTILELSVLLKYKSIYSLKLHELLLSYYRKTLHNEQEVPTYEVEFEINDLKSLLGILTCNECKYNTWVNFRRKVIELAITEINSLNHNFQINYKTLKNGKGGKIYAVKFLVEFKTQENGMFVENVKSQERKIEIDDQENSNSKVVSIVVDNKDLTEKKFAVQCKVKKMIKENIELREIEKICEAANYDYDKIKETYDIACVTSNINNLVGFMIKAIKDNYSYPVTKKKADNHKKNHFNDFEQRNYDYSKLERGLLGIEDIKDIGECEKNQS